MKKFLLLIIFSVIALSIHMNAQETAREVVATSQKSDDGVLLAYPNPAKDFIILKSKNPNLKIKAVIFYSILGVPVAQYYVNKNLTEIHLEQLKPGKYLMKYIMSDDSQKVTQIIKQ